MEKTPPSPANLQSDFGNVENLRRTSSFRSRTPAAARSAASPMTFRRKAISPAGNFVTSAAFGGHLFVQVQFVQHKRYHPVTSHLIFLLHARITAGFGSGSSLMANSYHGGTPTRATNRGSVNRTNIASSYRLGDFVCTFAP